MSIANLVIGDNACIIATAAPIIEQNKSIKEDVQALKDYNQEQLKRINKFYEINPRIQRPTAVVYPMVNHQIHPYDLTNQ